MYYDLNKLDKQVDFWHLSRELNREVTMSVSGEDADELKNILISAGMSPVVAVNNLQKSDFLQL